MQNSPGSQPLRILVATEDRTLQRRLSQFFHLMGYPALQAADPQSALAAVEAEGPTILLISTGLASAAGWELCRSLSEQASSAGLFKFLMVQKPNEILLQDALEAGIDDFLLEPIEYGELLSRLRSAARVLEYDRRVSQQRRLDARTGLLSRGAIITELRGQLAEKIDTSTACVVLDIDFFNAINRLHGAAAGDALLQAVAQELDNLRGGSEVLGYFEANRFCAILPDSSASTAFDWAERARQVLAATELKFGEITTRVTASFGVAESNASESAEQLVERAAQALQMAKSSGRNCVMPSGELVADSTELTAPGRLFERTTARDVMTPCTVYLQSDEPVGQAIDLLLRTRLDGIPVVDASGKLLGLCEKNSVAGVAESDYDRQLVRDLMTTSFQCFGEQESLASLLDFLGRGPGSFAFVVDQARPVGFVTSDSMLAMSRRVTTGSFVTESEYRATSDYLVVQDQCPAECTQTP